MAVFVGAGDRWPVKDIDVQSGLLRIDVCGKLQVNHIIEIRHFIDTEGMIHDPSDFYIEDEA